VWYEIGRIQTPGGAFFQKDCVCTTLNVSFDHGPSGSSGNGTVENACRFLEPATGWPVSFVSHLSDMRLPGQWLNRFNSAYAVNYTIIEKGTDAATGEEYSVEYDCGSQALFGTNYCIHILARRPTMSDGLRERLLQRALALGINTRDLPFVLTNQSSTCKYV
jgi:apolipoprotein D and lipocalin family protein